MHSDELRALAEALRPMAKAPCFDGIDIERAADYLRAQADAQPVLAVPAGWKPVPVEPTEAMREAADHDTTYYGHVATNNYKAMLAAAPAAPQAEPKPTMLASHRRLVEQAIQNAEHPSGMSTHDGKARIDASVLRRMLAIIDSLPAVPQAEPCIGNDPTCPCQDGDACHYRDAADGTKGWPVPQAEPKREPLTARRILEIEDDAIRQWRDNGMIDDPAVVFARMIERAHGIGGSDAE